LGILLSENVRKRILAKVTPTQKELDLQKTIIDTLKHALSDHPNSANYTYSFIEAQGSTGRKQTQLRGTADIDLFVGLVPENYAAMLDRPIQTRHQALDDLMSNMVNNWFEPAVVELETTDVQRAFSQHPYLSLKMMGLEIDILGCFDIDADYLSEKGPITAVDRTVHHTRYVADLLTDVKRDDARILKSFVRACHAYGDQCAVGRMGITGVSLELLVILSKSLEDAFTALGQLDGRPIDPLKLEQDRKEAIRKQQEQHQRVAIVAQHNLRSAKLEKHSYLVRKGFKDELGLVLNDDLLVPMRDFRTQAITSLQRISLGGGKKFMTGGRTKGAVFVIGKNRNSRGKILCEGYATGLSIRAALEYMRQPYEVWVCFSASNIVYVADKVGGARFVVADNDASETGRKAAEATGLPWTMPTLTGQDFNDLHQSEGLGACVKLLRGLLQREAA